MCVVGEEGNVTSGALIKEHVLFSFDDADEYARDLDGSLLVECSGVLGEDGDTGLKGRIPDLGFFAESVVIESVEEFLGHGEGILLWRGCSFLGFDVHHLGDRALGHGALSLDLLEEVLCFLLCLFGAEFAVAFGEDLGKFFFGEECFALVEGDLEVSAVGGDGFKAKVTEGAIAPEAESLIASDADDVACGGFVGGFTHGQERGKQVSDVCILGALEQVLFLFPLVEESEGLFDGDADAACEHLENERGIGSAQEAEGLGDACGFGGLFLGKRKAWAFVYDHIDGAEFKLHRGRFFGDLNGQPLDDGETVA